MATERKAVDGVVFSLTNLSGAYTNVTDDPDSPDANWLTTSNNNADTDVRASVPTPTGNPTVGAGLQEFRVQVRKWDGTGTPTVRVEVWETGGSSALAASSEIDVTSATGQVVSLTWNASILGTADGSAVEIVVHGTKTGGSPSTRATVEVGAIEWNVDYTTAANNYTITGAVTQTTTPTATALAFNRHASLAGAVTATASVAATMVYNFVRSLAGAVTATVSPVASALLYNINKALAGAVTVTASPTASALAYNRNASLAGAVTVTASPVASALVYNLNAALAGSVTVSATPAATMQYAGSAPEIVGAVTVTAAPAATMAFNKHYLFAGDTTVTGTPTATLLAYNRHAALTGAVTVTANPLAAALLYNRHAALVGAITATASVAASLSYNAAGGGGDPDPYERTKKVKKKFIHKHLVRPGDEGLFRLPRIH